MAFIGLISKVLPLQVASNAEPVTYKVEVVYRSPDPQICADDVALLRPGAADKAYAAIKAGPTYFVSFSYDN